MGVVAANPDRMASDLFVFLVNALVGVFLSAFAFMVLWVQFDSMRRRQLKE